ncbi:hypothetical protein FIBSPDRAFT_894603 [Athelia psychrophila]|uniref:Uncharacterized protein n=1 Tax=Athelia psychrophila TaxID=1759441 RepID=A0A166FPG8_9AGAM|nr:hypothetical protein FIBSPDRAFT_894603 [Fibularhizoctonia sp. CBS 109695]
MSRFVPAVDASLKAVATLTTRIHLTLSCFFWTSMNTAEVKQRKQQGAGLNVNVRKSKGCCHPWLHQPPREEKLFLHVRLFQKTTRVFSSSATIVSGSAGCPEWDLSSLDSLRALEGQTTTTQVILEAALLSTDKDAALLRTTRLY